MLNDYKVGWEHPNSGLIGEMRAEMILINMLQIHSVVSHISPISPEAPSPKL